MHTLTAAEIADLHARHTRKGAGYAPPLDACLAAARTGTLWDVDTQSAGEDCLAIGESPDDVLAEVALYAEPELASAHGEGAAAWAREHRWSAERITLAAE